MIDSRGQQLSHTRKKNAIPLSKLRTSEVLRAVVDHPRRLAELIGMLEDKSSTVRGRAASTLARLAESHAGRLVRIIDRLREGLSDDSAYVRWSLAYALGRIGTSFPNFIPRILMDLSVRLEDENRIVRIFAERALVRITACRPQLVKELFEAGKKEMPEAIGRTLKNAAKRDSRSSLRD